MRSMSGSRAVAAMLGLVGGIACAGAPGTSATVPAPSPAGEQGDAATAARVRADSLRRPYTQADIRFMSGMIGHHAQALVMSRWAKDHGASAPIRTLADRIVNAQEDEIATMQQWLRERRQPVPPAASTAGDHAMHGGDHAGHQTMPGMLTAAQLAQLDAARGPEFDRLFLTFMIQHHRGAVAMVKELFASYGAAQDETVFKFASDVQVDQITEIDRMQRMLADIVFASP